MLRIHCQKVSAMWLSVMNTERKWDEVALFFDVEGTGLAEFGVVQNFSAAFKASSVIFGVS